MALSDYTTQTLYILYIFTGFAMFLMIFRVILRRVRGQKWNLSDYLTMSCMFFLLARTSMIHVVLVWGTNNVPKIYRHFHTFTEKEIYQRETASKLLLVSRTMYNTYLWIQKGIVLLLYRRILFGLPWTDKVINAYWGILGATYVVIQVVTFTDCRPVYLYWQVVPDPGTCSEALGQLIILGALNIFTDILLIILPMPALFEIRRSFPAKLRLFGLFSIGIFLVVITVIRLPLNFDHGMYQVNRTTWASVESFGAAFVANIPTLYTLRKRQKATPPPIGEGMDRTIGVSDDSFMSEETFDHDPALDKEYGNSRVAASIEIFERAAQGDWPLPGPSRVKDNNAT
ncbi:hypothetical protein N431DRAFT_495177 [Stipitochalara longipes BDJ]|nr:hypothetical protein N431DRAFT_495177 [Stipitochalara longipes BDJ]